MNLNNISDQIVFKFLKKIEYGQLKIINYDGSVILSELKKGVSYFREKGVNHNVINENKFHYSFIEIEIK